MPWRKNKEIRSTIKNIISPGLYVYDNILLVQDAPPLWLIFSVRKKEKCSWYDIKGWWNILELLTSAINSSLFETDLKIGDAFFFSIKMCVISSKICFGASFGCVHDRDKNY